MTEDIRVVFIGSVRPEPSSAASLTLYRHLVDRSGFRLSVYPGELRDIAPRHPLVRLLGRLSRTRLNRSVADLEFWLHGRLPLEKNLPPPSDRSRSLVLTLAYGNGWQVARRYARLHGLPLVVRFDDWWPDMASVHAPTRRAIQQEFLQLAVDAASNICISEPMRAALGSLEKSVVVLPTPAEGYLRPAALAAALPPLRICYLGNMFDYGPMLAGLAEQSLRVPDLRFEFRGNEPVWPAALSQKLRQRGQLHGFQQGPVFTQWFENFHVYLVAMFFDLAQRRRVETCFATKLAEYSALGRPILIWAPATAGVVKWAQKNSSAKCVTDHSPSAVIVALRELAADTAARAELGTAARRAYETDFNPTRLHERFIGALETGLATRR
jgi:hypothetical protein